MEISGQEDCKETKDLTETQYQLVLGSVVWSNPLSKERLREREREREQPTVQDCR